MLENKDQMWICEGAGKCGADCSGHEKKHTRMSNCGNRCHSKYICHPVNERCEDSGIKLYPSNDPSALAMGTIDNYSTFHFQEPSPNTHMGDIIFNPNNNYVAMPVPPTIHINPASAKVVESGKVVFAEWYKYSCPDCGNRWQQPSICFKCWGSTCFTPKSPTPSPYGYEMKKDKHCFTCKWLDFNDTPDPCVFCGTTLVYSHWQPKEF